MIVKIHFRRIFLLLFLLYLVGSYPANWYMMKESLGFYAIAEDWELRVLKAERDAYEVGLKKATETSKDGRKFYYSDDPLHELRYCKYPDTGLRAWSLVFSPFVVPANLVYWIAQGTVHLPPQEQ